MSTKAKLYVVLADIHYPDHDARAFRAVLQFIKRNRKQIAGIVLLGDALDCQSLSRHTRGKPRLRKRGGYKEDIEGFKADILDRIEELIKPGTRLWFVAGNHEDWVESDLLDEAPELEGIVDIPVLLDLERRGWKWIPCGGHIEIGRVVLLHGDQIGSGVHVAKKLVDSVNATVCMGHVHRYSAFSRTSLVTDRRKWIGYTLPCLCHVAPHYAKSQPNAWVTGFGVLEVYGRDWSNVYAPIIMPDGTFSYGGIIYGK